MDPVAGLALRRHQQESDKVSGEGKSSRALPGGQPSPHVPSLRLSRPRLFLELRVDLDLIPRHHFVGFVGHADDCHEFLEHRISHALLLGGNGV